MTGTRGETSQQRPLFEADDCIGAVPVKRTTALEDLLQVAAESVYDERLYRTLDRLLPHKEAIEQHLVKRLGELFDLDYELLLYDVTSTYFEGQCADASIARRGYSRDHRPDCVQVNIALVVTRDTTRA